LAGLNGFAKHLGLFYFGNHIEKMRFGVIGMMGISVIVENAIQNGNLPTS
jgi:hypothetical protein